MMNHRKKTVNCIEMAEIRVKGGEGGGIGRGNIRWVTQVQSLGIPH